MLNFDIDIGIFNVLFKVFVLLVICNSIWFGFKIIFLFNYKWDFYVLFRCVVLLFIFFRKEIYFL